MKLLREYIREVSLGQGYGIKYTAFVLDATSHKKLASLKPAGWSAASEHMTIINPPNQDRRLPSRWLDFEGDLKVTAIAQNEHVMTGLVDLGDLQLPMKGPAFPHITIASNPQSSVPRWQAAQMSNEFSLSDDFEPIPAVTIRGTIKEIMKEVT